MIKEKREELEWAANKDQDVQNGSLKHLKEELKSWRNKANIKSDKLSDLIIERRLIEKSVNIAYSTVKSIKLDLISIGLGSGKTSVKHGKVNKQSNVVEVKPPLPSHEYKNKEPLLNSLSGSSQSNRYEAADRNVSFAIPNDLFDFKSQERGIYEDSMDRRNLAEQDYRGMITHERCSQHEDPLSRADHPMDNQRFKQPCSQHKVYNRDPWSGNSNIYQAVESMSISDRYNNISPPIRHTPMKPAFTKYKRTREAGVTRYTPDKMAYMLSPKPPDSDENQGNKTRSHYEGYTKNWFKNDQSVAHTNPNNSLYPNIYIYQPNGRVPYSKYGQNNMDEKVGVSGDPNVQPEDQGQDEQIHHSNADEFFKVLRRYRKPRTYTSAYHRKKHTMETLQSVRPHHIPGDPEVNRRHEKRYPVYTQDTRSNKKPRSNPISYRYLWQRSQKIVNGHNY